MEIAKQTYKNRGLRKASIDTQTGGAGTAGTALVPVYPDPNIVNRTIRQTPLRNMVPRRAVRGLTYDYIPLTAKGGAFWAASAASAMHSRLAEMKSETSRAKPAICGCHLGSQISPA